MSAAPRLGHASRWLSHLVLVIGCVGLAALPNRSAHAKPRAPTSDPFRRATAALLWPGATRSFFVSGSGVCSNGEWQTVFEPSHDGLPAHEAHAVACSDDDLPVLHWEMDNSPLTWYFEAVAVPGPDSILFASVAVRVINHGAYAVQADLRTTLAPLSSPAAFVAWDSDSASNLMWAGADSPIAHGWRESLAPDSGDTATWRLRPGHERTRRYLLPAYACPSERLIALSKTSHRAYVSRARSYWTNALAAGMQLSIGDRHTESAYRQALVVLLGCTQRHKGALIPIGNPFQYRDIWLRDGARCIAALAMAGQTSLARALATSFLRYQWPQGPFLSQRGQLDGTGQALWAFEQAFLRPSPDSSLATVTNAAVSAWRWMELQRTSTRILLGKMGGLLPYAEPRDGELPHGRGQLTGNDAWAIAGYRATARLLEGAGRAHEAIAVRQSLSNYQAEFARHLAESKSADVPPAWDRPAIDWGNASVAYPCGALSAADPRFIRLAERLWSDSPEPGLVRYGKGDSTHTYLAADLGMSAMLTGRIDDANRVIEALIRWRTASGGSPEIFDRATRDYGSNLPPHATAAAAIVTLIRNSLIYDDEDTLRLTMAARPQWWRRGRFERAPTRWGLLDVSFSLRHQRATWKWTAVSVPTILTAPPGYRIDHLNSPVASQIGPRQIVVPPGRKWFSAELERVY